MVTETINIVVTERGSRTVSRNIERIGERANTATRGLRALQNVLFVLGAAGAVRGLVRVVDQLTNFRNRIRLVTDNVAELNAVQRELFEVAANTRTTFEATATIYTRTALAVRNLGISQREAINFTQSLNQATILSGANIREANAALIQLSQGLSSDRLSGDELRSVLEQLPFVADVIAESLGVTRGELRALGREGKIAAVDILRAFREAREEIAERFAETIPTLGQAFTVLTVRFQGLLASFNDATGTTSILARAIIGLSDSLDLLAIAVAGMVAVLAVRTFRSYAIGIGQAVAANRALVASIAAGTTVASNFRDIEIARSGALVAGTAATANSGRAILERNNAVRQSRTAALAARLAETRRYVAQQNGLIAVDLVTGRFTRKQLALNEATRNTNRLENIRGIRAGIAAREAAMLRNQQAALTRSITRYNTALLASDTFLGRLSRSHPRFARTLRRTAVQFRRFDQLLGRFSGSIVTTAILTIIASLVLFSNRIMLIEGSTATLRDNVVAAFRIMRQEAQSAANAIAEATADIGSEIQKLTGITDAQIASIERYFASWNSGFTTALFNLNNFRNVLFQLGLIGDTIQQGLGVEPTSSSFLGRFLAESENVAAERRVNLEQTRREQLRAASTGRGSPNARSTFSEQIQSIRQETAVLKENEATRQGLQEVLKIEQALKGELIDLEKIAIFEAVRRREEARREGAELDRLQAPLREYNNSLRSLSNLHARGTLSATRYRFEVRALREEFQRNNGTVQNLIALQTRENSLARGTRAQQIALALALKASTAAKRDLNDAEKISIFFQARGIVLREQEDELVKRLNGDYTAITDTIRILETAIDDKRISEQQGLREIERYSLALRAQIAPLRNLLILTKQQADLQRLGNIESARAAFLEQARLTRGGQLTLAQRLEANATFDYLQLARATGRAVDTLTGTQREHELTLQGLFRAYRDGTGEYHDYIRAVNAANAAHKAANMTFADHLKLLDEQIITLRKLRSAQDIVNAIKQIEISLNRELDPTERRLAENKLAAARAARIYGEELQAIRGPAEAFRESMLAITAALFDGRIEVEEFIIRAAQLRKIFENANRIRGRSRTTFADIQRRLENENMLLRLNTLERERLAPLLRAEEQLKRKLTDPERAILLNLTTENQLLGRAAELYTQINEPILQYQLSLRALSQLLDGNRISQEQYTQALRTTRIAFLETQQDFASGFERGFLKILENTANTAQQIEGIVTNAFDSISSAIADLVVDGEADFASLFRTINKQIVQLVISQGFKQLFGGTSGLGQLFGGTSGAAAGAGIGDPIGNFFRGLPALQRGADFTIGSGLPTIPNGGADNRVVAFRGQDGEEVSVTPRNGRQQQQSINVTFNISTPDAGSFRDSETQIASRLTRVIGQGRRNL